MARKRTGRCPLEDSGGVWGYRELMRALEDPSSKYREHFPDFHREGATWDPEDADLDARNHPSRRSANRTAAHALRQTLAEACDRPQRAGIDG